MTHPLSSEELERESVTKCDLSMLKLNQKVELAMANGKLLTVNVLPEAKTVIVASRDYSRACIGPVELCHDNDIFAGVAAMVSRIITVGKWWQYGDKHDRYWVSEITILTIR